MKKYILVTLCLFFLISCSSDDSSSQSSSDLFMKINISGVEYNSDGLFATGFSGEENCDTNGDLFLQIVGQIETSEVFVDGHFVHFENAEDFNDGTKNNTNVTRVTDTNDLWELSLGGDACSKANDFSIIYENKLTNEYLSLKNGAAYTHVITRSELVSEDSAGEQYIVEGEFSATFNDNSVDIPVYGNYRTKIDVLK